MKLKSILYRKYETLSDIEKEFFKDNDHLRLCDATNVVYLSTQLVWIEESFESLTAKGLKTIESNPHLTAVCEDYWNNIN